MINNIKSLENQHKIIEATIYTSLVAGNLLNAFISNELDMTFIGPSIQLAVGSALLNQQLYKVRKLARD